MPPSLDDIGDLQIASSSDPASAAGITLNGDPATATSAVGAPLFAGMPEDGGIDSGSIEAALSAKAIVPPTPVDAAVAAETPPESTEQVQKSRAQQRIQQIIAERNDERKRSEALQVQLQNVFAQQAQTQAEFQKRQLDLEQKRFEMVEAQQRAEVDANLSDVDRARKSFLSEAAAQARAALEPEIKQLRAERDAEKAAQAAYMQQVKAEQETAQRLQHFGQRADQALTNDLLKGYAPEDATGLKDEMEEMLYSFAGAFGADPVDIAPRFKQFISKLVKAENKKVSRSAATTIAASQGTVAPLPQGRPGVGNSAVPSLQQLRRNGYENHVQWMGKGSKPMSRA